MYKLSQILSILFFINFQSIYSFTSFPVFKLEKENYLFINDKTPSGIMKSIFHADLYTYIEIGTPSQKVPVFLKMSGYDYYITSSNTTVSKELDERKNFNILYNISNELLTSKNSFSYYDENSSSSNYLNSISLAHYSLKGYCEEYHYNETIKLYTDYDCKENIKKELKSIPINIVRLTNENLSGQIGLLLPDKVYHSEDTFFSLLKKNNMIENYYFGFVFDKNIKLILGNDFQNILNDKIEYKTTNIYDNGKHQVYYWKIEFDKITIANKEYGINNTISEIIYDMDTLIGPYQFEVLLNELIFNKSISDGNCFKDSIYQKIHRQNTLYFYYCKKSMQQTLYSILPSLNFLSRNLNETFILSKDELFETIDDYIYLKILFYPKQEIAVFGDNIYWTLGGIFTKKYQFIFNQDSKTVGYFKKINENTQEKGNAFIIIIEILGIILLLLLIAFVGYKLYTAVLNKRKKKANELVDDNYDYSPQDVEGINVDEK